MNDKLALQSFMLAQYRLPLPAVLIAAGLLQSLKSSAAVNRLMNAITTGWNLGLSTKPLLAQRWEEGWDKPLSVWQAELGLQPGYK